MELILSKILNKLDTMQLDITEIKTDVAVLKSDVAVLKTDVAVLKTDVALLKSDVAELKTDVAVLKSDVAVLKIKVDDLTAAVDRIEVNQNEDLLSILKRIDHNTSQKDYEMVAINKRLFHVEADVARLADQKVG